MNNDFTPRRGPLNNGHSYGPHQPMRPHANSMQPTPGAFRTPESVAAHEEQQPETTTAGPIIGHHQKPKKSLKEKLASLTKKQWIIIGIVAAVILGGGTLAAIQLFGKEDKKPVARQEEPKQPAAKPQPLYSTLTGLPIPDKSVNDRPVTAIMIENSQDARPQSGIYQAGVVFEAVAEGGITRFLTLFQDKEPDYVGPVRSVRPYYVKWLRGFDAAVAHVGGSTEALAMVRGPGGKDLDQFFNPSAYWRITGRYAPHNMYTSVPKLRQVEKDRGYGKSNYDGFPRKSDMPSTTPTAKSIDFTISSPVFNSHFDYNPKNNTYLRSEGGQKHIDERTGNQLSPKVVIGLVMSQGKNGIYTTYDTIGGGKAYFFQDGTVTEGTWHKRSETGQFVFKDTKGAIIKLNRGQTWLTVVGSSDRVTYKP